MGAQGARQVESGNEWATPWWVVKDACAMLGIEGFDLDPAATAENSKAKSHIDRLRDGTLGNWWGNVWLNPPFSRSLAACLPGCKRKTCQKRGYHLEDDQHGALDFAIAAVNCLHNNQVKSIAWHGPVAPDTDWYGLLWPYVHERADYNGRIPYNEGKSGGTFPSQTLILKPEKRASGQVPTILLPVQARGIKETTPVSRHVSSGGGSMTGIKGAPKPAWCGAVHTGCAHGFGPEHCGECHQSCVRGKQDEVL